MLAWEVMEITNLKQTETEATFTVRLTESELKPTVEHVFDHLRDKVRAKGFRPGKAPNNIVERELGAQAVQSEVLEAAINASYGEAAQRQDLRVIAPPQINLKKFVPYTELEYEAKVALLAPVKLGDYKSIRLARPSIKVTNADIDAAIEDLRRRQASRIEVKRAAKQGDEVTFDFAGAKDGEPVRGATAEKFTLKLGSGQFIPGFEDELIGLKPGAGKTFKITFPADYHDDGLKGQEVEFKVKLHRVAELALPEVTDDFAAAVGPVKTIVELRTNITEELASGKAETAAREYENLVLDEVLKRATYAVPEVLVQEQEERQMEELAQNLSYSGLDVDRYLQMTGKTRDDLLKEQRPDAERRVALALVLTEVATAEKVAVTEQELDDEIMRLKQQYPEPATQAELDKPETRNDIYNRLMSSRVIGKLVEYAEQGKK